MCFAHLPISVSLLYVSQEGHSAYSNYSAYIRVLKVEKKALYTCCSRYVSDISELVHQCNTDKAFKAFIKPFEAPQRSVKIKI